MTLIYKDYCKDVCHAYATHNINMLTALENDAKMNDTPHWYSELIADLDKVMYDYMIDRFDG